MEFGEEGFTGKRIEQSLFKWTSSRKHNIESSAEKLKVQTGIASQMRCTCTSAAGFIDGSVQHIALEIQDATPEM